MSSTRSPGDIREPKTRAVSFPGERLVLVDSDDNPTGVALKSEAHAGNGLLHRAFSIFLFDHQGRVLLHERSAEKPLWPGYWTNSCCSHPREGENYRDACRRRLRQELGVSCELGFLYRFQYQAQFGEQGAEHELCSVFAGVLDPMQQPRVHPAEIASWDWFTPATVNRWIREGREQFTPWFLSEWEQLMGVQWPRLRDILRGGHLDGVA